MTQDDIIRMVREAGAAPSSPVLGIRPADLAAIEGFAARVAAAEREACAQVCEANSHPCREFIDQANICAAAIRARSEKGMAS